MLTDTQIAEEAKRLLGDKLVRATIIPSPQQFNTSLLEIYAVNGFIATVEVKDSDLELSIEEFSKQLLVPAIEQLEATHAD
jgi:hypothetical protein